MKDSHQTIPRTLCLIVNQGKILLIDTISKIDSIELVGSEEGELHWADLNRLDQINLIPDIKISLEKLNTIGEEDIFTAESEFDGGGKLLKIEFES